MAKELDVKKGQYHKVPFDFMIVDDGLNFRDEYGDIKELTESIRANGVQEAMRGWIDDAGYYHVVNGHRRFKAMEKLFNDGVKELYAPWFVIPKGTSEENTIVTMFVANDGKPFTLLEQAKGVEKLAFYGLENKDIAEKLGKSITHIQNLLLLAKAPAKFKKLIKNGTISGTYAIDLIKQGEDAVNKAIEDFSNVAEDSEENDGSKSKTAKVTKKDNSLNSISELKAFCKGSNITEFASKEHEKFYWLLQDLTANKVQGIDLVNFFTSGEYEQKPATAKKATKAGKAKDKKFVEAATLEIATDAVATPEETPKTKGTKKTAAKAAKSTKTKKTTKREILYDKKATK